MKSYKLIYIVSLLTLPFYSCKDLLEETVYSELTTDTYLTSTEAKLSILYSAYGNAQLRDYFYFYGQGMTSGETWNEFGAIESQFTPLCNFTWVSSHEYFSGMWNKLYSVIRDANIVLDNTSKENGETQLIAEAKFLRGFSYSLLYDWFGALPLYTSSSGELYLERSSEEETVRFIEKDLLDAAADLPVRQATYGKATKGAALGILTKLYLNTKQWGKSADIAQEIIDLNRYTLISDYRDIFSIENEGNDELILAIQANPQVGIPFVANTFPTDYPHLPNQTIYASRVYLYDNFVNSFDLADTRKDLIVTSYTNTNGEFIQLLGNDRSLAGKYEFDKDAAGASYGNDTPVLRYADILLARAEALNELNGPNDESIALINKIRKRAGEDIPLLQLAGFTKETLRDHIFKERAWEFYFEQKSRTDQIRQGTFISGALARGKTAKPFHVLFPIPETEINANPKLVQNTGY
ncbi:RagB/SusD family nutrient uptake outer membrane protein [termite gut metagenome]|uniref:RagB/SusD family nutrient uptake outer membrane protein n=1 Tax=termite gut metagenome TaxID=433724 RepID=A0A5J4SXN1_9ZZZZ